MEQKDYKMEIVGLLLQGKNHIRGIAHKLGTNHMLVARKVKELAKLNVVDFAWEGKNKSYFLKKTVESRAYVLMAESYRLVWILALYPGLRGIVEKIQRNRRIRMAILFGSHAKGLAVKDSDIDIYIETKNRSLRKEMRLLDSKLSIKVGEYDRQSPLIKEIEKDHVIIKGVEEFYEKNRFFS